MLIWNVEQLLIDTLFAFSAEAQLTEKTSLQGIQQLVRKTCQALALWKLLCEHQFSVVVGELQKVRSESYDLNFNLFVFSSWISFAT